MIYVTGDTHCPINIHKLNAKNFPQQKDMTKRDYVIILGDFGLIWTRNIDKMELYWTKWLNDKNFTTLFLDGNHENHHRLMSGNTTLDIVNTCVFVDNSVLGNYELQYHRGVDGYVGKISDSVFHLRRGEIYTIQGKKFFIMGGAESIDKSHRIEGKSWWREEIPNNREFNYGLDILQMHNNTVDYILGHTAPESIIKHLGNIDYGKCDPVTRYFDRIIEITKFESFYCGHFHIDTTVEEKYNFLFNKIQRII